MPVCGMDHVNIRTRDVQATRDFFQDVLGMEYGASSVSNGTQSAWMRDANGHAVIHIGHVDAYPDTIQRPFVAGSNNGAVHHVAFQCTDYDAMRDRLTDKGLRFRENAVPAFGLRQIFVDEPNGILLELNFMEG